MGTLDGANIEIREEVGSENIYIFGMTAEEVEYEKLHKSRTPWEIYNSNPVVHRIIDAIGNGLFSGGDTEIFRPIVMICSANMTPTCYSLTWNPTWRASKPSDGNFWTPPPGPGSRSLMWPVWVNSAATAPLVNMPGKFGEWSRVSKLQQAASNRRKHNKQVLYHLCRQLPSLETVSLGENLIKFAADGDDNTSALQWIL